MADIKRKKKQLHDEFTVNSEYSDYSAFNRIVQAIPKDWVVHVANSSPIRYVQLFDNSHIADMQCNRGTSGIEGCTGTAMGAASASPDKNSCLSPVTLHFIMTSMPCGMKLG